MNLSEQFSSMSKVFEAIGDSTRQHIILSMFELPCELEGGARVGEITAKASLSRPAISHHLKILRESGIVGMRREGTKNYYYLKVNSKELLQLKSLIDSLITLVEKQNGGKK